MEVVLSLVALAVIAYLLTKLVFRLLKNTTVYEYQSGLKYVNGKYQGLLGAGSYWHNPLKTQINTVDTRPLHQTIPSQEVLSEDGIAVKISLVANTKVVDPETAIHQTQDYLGAVYLELQQALRMVIGEKPIDQIMEARQSIGEAIEMLVARNMKAIGIEAPALTSYRRVRH